jgi:alkaline phosphatase D
VLGVWDDHDYGIGNGDQYFAGKEVFKKLYLNFIDEPAESER